MDKIDLKFGPKTPLPRVPKLADMCLCNLYVVRRRGASIGMDLSVVVRVHDETVIFFEPNCLSYCADREYFDEHYEILLNHPSATVTLTVEEK